MAQLATAERGVRAREPLRLARAAAALQHDFRKFSELRDQLQRVEPRVLALHDAAQLLRQPDAPHHAADICRRYVPRAAGSVAANIYDRILPLPNITLGFSFKL